MLDLIEREPAEGSEGGVENLVGRGVGLNTEPLSFFIQLKS